MGGKKEQADSTWECPEQIGGKGHLDRVTFWIVFFCESRRIRALLELGRRIERQEKKIRDLVTILCEFLISLFEVEDSEFVREFSRSS